MTTLPAATSASAALTATDTASAALTGTDSASAALIATDTAAAALPATDTAAAVAHFAGRLAFETDVADVATDLVAGVPDLVVVDSRNEESWKQGHIPGAVHLPTAEIAARAAALIPAHATVVTYCWGPGCNGATRAALEFAKLGYSVKEMLGGFEYWAREGLAVEGAERRPTDPLTAPTCAC